MPALILALALCSVLCRAVAVSSAGPASICDHASGDVCVGDFSGCASTHGISLLRASAWKSRVRINEEAEEEVRPTVVKINGTLSSASGQAASGPLEGEVPPAVVEVSGTLSSGSGKADSRPLEVRPAAAEGSGLRSTASKAAPASPAERRTLLKALRQEPVPQLPQKDMLRLWQVRMKAWGLDLDGAAVPLPLLVLAVVMVAAATSATIAAVVAVAALRRVKAVEQLQPPVRPDHIQGLPGEAYSLSEQEAKIKSVGSSDPGPAHRWEELNEPEAEWDTDAACSSNT